MGSQQPPLAVGALQSPRVRVTVVHGACGAGKTSLLHALERDDSVVVVRALFAVQIGCEPSRPLPGTTVVEVAESQEHLCLCCTPRDELRDVLVQLAGRARVTRIVVEMGGLADPAWMGVLLSDAVLRTRTELDSVVCVVHGPTFAQEPREAAVAGLRSLQWEQVAISSCVVHVDATPASRALLATRPRYLEGSLLLEWPAQRAAVEAAVLAPCVPWRVQPVVAADCAYFEEAVPYRRHQSLLQGACMVDIHPLSAAQWEAARVWLVQLAADPRVHRLYGTLFVADGRRFIVDAARGRPLVCVPGELWDAMRDVMATKVALIGEGVDSVSLCRAMQSATGITTLHPTVLYTAPPPRIDTRAQRTALLVTLALALLSLALPLDWPMLSHARTAIVALSLVYCVLSWKADPHE